MASLNDLKSLADQWEKNRRIVKAYGDELRKNGLAEKDAASLAQKAAKMDEDALKKKTEGLKAAKDDIKKVADVLGQVRDVGKDAFAGIASGMAALTSGDVKGAMDGLVDSVAALAKGLDLVYPGLGQAAAALVKFAGGGAGLMYELAAKTIDENQKLLELRNTFDALGSNVGKTGGEMVDHFRELSRELPQTRAKLAEMAIPLLEAGVQGDKLDQSLRAQSAASAMLGERGGQAYASLAQKARDAQRHFQPLVITQKELLSTGINTKDLAEKLGTTQDDLNARIRFGIPMVRGFGDALDEAITKKGEKASKSLMGTIGTIVPKMQESIGRLFSFSDKDTTKGMDNFTNMFQKFANIFDESTESGKMLKETLHDIVDGVLDKAGNVLHTARRGFKMLEIVWTELRIQGHPLWRAIDKLNEALEKSGHHGITFKQALNGIGKAAGFAFENLAKLVTAATQLTNIANKIGENNAAGAAGHTGVSAVIGAINPVLGVLHLLGHADGGVVTGMHNGLATVQAAPGEGLASIGRGERIVPAGKSEGGGGWHVNVMAGAVVVGGGGQKGDTDLTEEGLSLVFERIRMKQGLA